MAKYGKRLYCKHCDYFCFSPDDLASHIEKKHIDLIPPDMDVWQYLYFIRTGKDHGTCVICRGETNWNEKTHKYHRFCKNPKCREKYREIFKNRMIGKYGKTTLLNDPEQQKKMLANRKISGEYVWRDHITKSTYTGSYERNFLEFLDVIVGLSPQDIMAPSPHTYWYIYEGQKHFYMPDFFIPSLGVEIEIKDGGDNPNNHGKIQSVDKVKEVLKDAVLAKGTYDYIKIVNKDNDRFFEYLEHVKERTMYETKGNIVII